MDKTPVTRNLLLDENIQKFSEYSDFTGKFHIKLFFPIRSTNLWGLYVYLSGVTTEDFIEENVNIMKHTLFILQIFLFSIVFGQNENIEKLQFEFEVDSIELHVGETKELTIKLLNEDGDLSQNSFYVFGQRRALSVSPRTSDSTGIATVTVKAHKPGRLRLSVQSITVKRDDRVRDKLVVNVPLSSN